MTALDDIRGTSNVVSGDGTVRGLPWDGPSSASYSGNVPGRLGYDDEGMSAATRQWTGLPTDPGDPEGSFSPMSLQPTEPTTQRMLSLAQNIIGLGDGGPRQSPAMPEDMNQPGLILARAGAPTDNGRIGVAVFRDYSAVTTWDQVDDGLGMKHESAPPLASGPFYAATGVRDALPSAGGSFAAQPAPLDVQVNTYRSAPTPWDQYIYIGGPDNG